MISLSKKHQEIIDIFLKNDHLQSSEVHTLLRKREREISLITVKRTLADLVEGGVLIKSGLGRAVHYSISIRGRILVEVDAREFSLLEPDKRPGFNNYNSDLIKHLSEDIFSQAELGALEQATAVYKERINGLSSAIQKKELERLIIELSWKSSKIEGNTYTLLDTEKLILENKEAPGHDKKEAQMILNHKEAFEYVYQNPERFKFLTKQNLEELHSIIIKDLNVDSGLRKKLVGITGSKYRPLDNVYQITEAVEDLNRAVFQSVSDYAKSLIAILGISYIQPFDDGNKRTGRLMANALLLAHGLAPLSYRNVDEKDYREAMLVWYELNSITPFKKLFIGQYEFAAQNYAVAPPNLIAT